MAWLRFKQNKAALLGLGITSILLLIAALAPWIAPEDPLKADLRHALEPPSISHILGRDELGRDILSRVIVGSRLSIGISFLAVLIGTTAGVAVGLASGYYGRWVDSFIQRITDILLAFPTFLLALALVAVLGIGITNVIISVGVSTIPVYIRLTRGLVLSVKGEEYIEAAKALGKSSISIIGRHVLPNIFHPIIVQSTYHIGWAILVAAGLGFLGLGVPPPIPEWGSMLGSGRAFIFSHPHLTYFPGIAIFLAVLGFNLVGDGLRDALDPKLRVRRV
jgi:ABC-type dipeptide/oligopeptide/nickel transport system permease subunit